MSKGISNTRCSLEPNRRGSHLVVHQVNQKVRRLLISGPGVVSSEAAGHGRQGTGEGQPHLRRWSEKGKE